MPTLFVVIPVFNEPQTLREVVHRVAAVPLEGSWQKQIVLVDDGSDAPTAIVATELARELPDLVSAIRHQVNRGKGAALRTGFEHAISRSSGPKDCVIIQDADLEYDPTDFITLVQLLESHKHNCAVFGNRWHRGTVEPGVRGRLHMCANRTLTWASNLATGLRVADMECCYKLLPVALLKRILPRLTEQRFGIEPQIAAALARDGTSVVELPVSYSPRSFKAGKKIGPIDGVRAIWVILRSTLG